MVVVFPGQGSQFVGMGSDLVGDEASYFSRVDDILGYKLSEIIKNGPAEQLRLTENAQPAIIAYELALFSRVKKILHEELDVSVRYVLGHSVGEYAALVVAEVLSFEDAIRLVHLRGKFMQQAVPVGVGKMVAVLKMPEQDVRTACIEASFGHESVIPANYNDPEQIVISGHAGACDRAVKTIEQIAAMRSMRVRTIPLEVSAPFHSPLMKPAAEKLQEEIAKIKFHSNKIAYIANTDAKIYGPGSNPDKIKKNLVEQVAGSVFWSQSIQALPADTKNCLEVGPGKVLKGMIKKIRPEINVLSVGDMQALSELKKGCI